MRDLSEQGAPETPVNDQSVRELLVALGDWGVAEVRGEPFSILEDLHARAKEAFKAASAAA